MAKDVGEVTREDLERSRQEYKRQLDNYIGAWTKMARACAGVGIKVNLPKFKKK